MNDLISRKALLEDIKNQYSLSYGEILINPRDFYEMVECQEVIKKQNECNVCKNKDKKICLVCEHWRYCNYDSDKRMQKMRN